MFLILFRKVLNYVARLINIFNIKTVQRLANRLIRNWLLTDFISLYIFLQVIFWLKLFFLKIAYKVINVRLFTKNIDRLFQLIYRKLKEIYFFRYLTFIWINLMNFRIETYLMVLIFLFIVEILYVAQIFEEILCFERITIKRRLLLGLVWGALPCSNFFKSSVSFFENWLCISNNHGRILRFPSFILHVIKFYSYRN